MFPTVICSSSPSLVLNAFFSLSYFTPYYLRLNCSSFSFLIYSQSLPLTLSTILCLFLHLPPSHVPSLAVPSSPSVSLPVFGCFFIHPPSHFQGILSSLLPPPPPPSSPISFICPSLLWFTLLSSSCTPSTSCSEELVTKMTHKNSLHLRRWG